MGDAGTGGGPMGRANGNGGATGLEMLGGKGVGTGGGGGAAGKCAPQ